MKMKLIVRQLKSIAVLKDNPLSRLKLYDRMLKALGKAIMGSLCNMRKPKRCQANKQRRLFPKDRGG